MGWTVTDFESPKKPVLTRACRTRYPNESGSTLPHSIGVDISSLSNDLVCHSPNSSEYLRGRACWNDSKNYLDNDDRVASHLRWSGGSPAELAHRGRTHADPCPNSGSANKGTFGKHALGVQYRPVKDAYKIGQQETLWK